MNALSIENIRAKCKAGDIKWSAHAAARILQRGISREDIIHCIMDGEIIEEYPDYWLSPACLIFGHTKADTIIHVVVGVDDMVHIVTAYYPDEIKFMPDMKTRRK